MAFQLRRMVLVNAGTNKGRPSGLFASIDPRGGAAVVGANGVGKTSTLRLIPLFFGHPTSQVVALNQGQEGVRFILPSPTSAICFEYQRGSDAPEDLRLAVMRPRADADAPEYRIFPCGFRKELFVQDNHFVTDDVTCAIALKDGIAPTSKLNTAEYRSVILGSRSFSKEHKKLLAYARQYSFGPRELPNLDKLVATMVKDGVRFEDLVQVAVGLIELERGGDQRQRLTFRQQRRHLEDWLRNLDAARIAVAAQPRATTLSGMCLDLNTLEREWRNLHHEALVVTQARRQDKEAEEHQLAALNAARADEVRHASARQAQLENEAGEAGRDAGRAKSAYDTARGEQLQFEQEEAQRWSLRLEELGPLQASRAGLESRIAAATRSASGISTQYRKEESNMQESAARERTAAEARKKPVHDEFERDQQSIDAAERTQLKDLSTEILAVRTELQDKAALLQEQVGRLRGEAQNPPRPQSLEKALSDARQRRDNHVSDMRRHANQVHDALRVETQVRRNFEQAELTVADSRRRLAEAHETLQAAQSQLRPADGTLLSALRAHGGEQWKVDLARVIDSRLLQRTDLQPLPPSDDAVDSLYGWRLATTQIEPPAWSDDARLREALAQAQESLKAAETVRDNASARLARVSAELEAAEQAHREVQAEESVLAARDHALKDAVEDAESALQTALRAAREQAGAELTKSEAALRKLRDELAALDRDQSTRASAISNMHKERLAAARQRRDDALQAIGLAIAQIDEGLSQRMREIKAQEDQHLKAEGIDVATVSALQSEIDDCMEMIRALKLKEPIVANWKLWSAAGGEVKVVGLRDAAERQVQQANEAAARVEDHRALMQDSQKAHDRAAGAHRDRIEQLATDLQLLEALPEMFGDYAPTAYEGVDLTQRGAAVKQKVRLKHDELRRAMRDLESAFNSLYKDLTARESTTRDLVERHLAEAGQSTYARAVALVSASRRVDSQVIPELRNTLQTVLANIGAFNKSILGFEREVSAFNSRLQEALREVKRFDRVDELHLNIVADFESLHFYKKLRHMDTVVREHQASATDSNALPPPATAEALRDFLGVMAADGTLEVNLGAHISLSGSVVENGNLKVFRRPAELGGVSSNGLTGLILITLLIGLVNTVRRGDDVCIPWVTDEVGKFDPSNFAALIRMLADNRIDVITASPALDMTHFVHFAHRYVFEDNGVVCHYAPPTQLTTKLVEVAA